MLKPPVKILRTPGTPKPLNGRSALARKVYHSARWLGEVRPAKLRRDPLCQMCLYRGVVSVADTVDHWVSIQTEGDPWADENLVSLDRSCHSKKTICEQNGKPLPPIVPSTPRKYVIA